MLIPELVKQHRWQHMLHRRRARRLPAALLRWDGEEGLAEEEEEQTAGSAAQPRR